MIDFSIKYSGIEKEILNSQKLVDKIHNIIWHKTGKGHKMLGWLDWPLSYDQKQIDLIDKKITELQNLGIETLLVIGIGGSYLGAKAGIDFIKGGFWENDKVLFAGINVSDSYILQIEKKLQNKKWALCVISKSGTTLEPAIAFRYFKNLLEKKHGKVATKKLIVTITDKEKGILKKISEEAGYQSFVIPSNIGGRFSVITAAGLFPMAFAGVNISKILEGTKRAREDFKEANIEKNIAYQYAIARFLLYKHNRIFEIFTTYDPDFTMFSEWWKQLFGESEGKEEKGLFPFSVNYSKDLHSLGQIIQDGRKVFFETTLYNQEDREVFISPDKNNFDLLNYLENKSLAEINREIFNAVLQSHANEAKISNFVIMIPQASEEVLGYLWFFFFIAVTASAYLLGLNPFDQPGVENYKKNMFINLRN